MAMADRRPLGIPVASAHAAPTFNTNTNTKLGGVRAMSDAKGQSERNAGFADIPENNNDNGSGSVSPGAVSPNSRSISPDSLMNSGPVAAKKDDSSNSSRGSTPPASQNGSSGPYLNVHANEQAGLSHSSMLGKKPKAAGRVPIATGISTTIPVTGEKPKPEQQGDASLEDDVLFAIFLILYEKDTEGAGMTVKQICDVLVERHPDMAQLSSKTSNLVSAKLNAYVKRVEKGDSNLRYALSREWADASPKRMVYVYRGLLAKDFHVHIRSAREAQKASGSGSGAGSGDADAFATDSFEAARQSALHKPRRQTMYDLGISRHAFAESADAAHLFVPYASAPVAANMPRQEPAAKSETAVATATEAASASATASGSAKTGESGEISKNKGNLETKAADEGSEKPAGAGSGATTSTSTKRFAIDSDFDLDDLEVFNDTDDDDEVDVFHLDITRQSIKRSKSMSHLAPEKKARFVTAAAAAPRVPRTPCSHSPMAAAAAAALHAAALKAIAAATATSTASNNVSGYVQDGNSGAGSATVAASRSNSVSSASNWASAVRSGFLTQEIGAPEDVSLADLDKLFA